MTNIPDMARRRAGFVTGKKSPYPTVKPVPLQSRARRRAIEQRRVMRMPPPQRNRIAR